MGLVEGGKRGLAALALATGVCLTASCALMAPPPAGDWRSLRRIDLPAQLDRVAWSDESFLAEGLPKQFGRTLLQIQPSGAARATIVKAESAGDGLVIDNLVCYNTVRGETKCALLLHRPNRCYLFIYAGSATSAGDKSPVSPSESFDVECPTYLTLRN